MKDIFEVGVIMENEDKAKDIKILSGDDCKITGKVLNKKKIILHLRRQEDGSEGNVFVRLKDGFQDQFPVSKRFLGSKKVIGLTLNEFKNFDTEKL